MGLSGQAWQPETIPLPLPGSGQPGGTRQPRALGTPLGTVQGWAGTWAHEWALFHGVHGWAGQGCGELDVASLVRG